MTKIIKKSYVKQIKDFDFSKKVLINHLSTTQEIVNNHYRLLKQRYFFKSEKDLWTMVKDMVLGDNVFSLAMKQIIPCYQIEIFDEDIENAIKRFWQDPIFVRVPYERLFALAKATITKDLIMEDLRKKWNININDIQVKPYIFDAYRTSGGGFSAIEAIKNKEKFDNIKYSLEIKLTIGTLLQKLNYEIDWDAISKQFTNLDS